jgi:hypothetical protein
MRQEEQVRADRAFKYEEHQAAMAYHAKQLEYHRKEEARMKAEKDAELEQTLRLARERHRQAEAAEKAAKAKDGSTEPDQR